MNCWNIFESIVDEILLHISIRGGTAMKEVNLVTDAKERKTYPVGTGFLDYFPLAAAEVAHVSFVGNVQHNGPNAPLHWDRSKSTDEADALIRHFLQRGTVDSDGVRHSAKMAWRALALLEKELEALQVSSSGQTA
jgi:hypothetical protein